MTGYENTKKQGNMGIGLAISYFTEVGYTVAIPLTDSQDYDLIIDTENGLKRVQVKTTRYQRRNAYEINLSVKGGNRTSKGKIKLFDTSFCDYLFIVTEGKKCYFIPSTKLSAKYILVLGPKYDKYLINRR